MLTLTLVLTITPMLPACSVALLSVMLPVALPSRLKPSSSVTPSVTALVTPRYMSLARSATLLTAMASSDSKSRLPVTSTALLTWMSSVLFKNRLAAL